MINHTLRPHYTFISDACKSKIQLVVIIVGAVSHVGDCLLLVYGGFEVRHGVCCVAQRCVRRWEPDVSEIGEYTGYCPRPEVMVLLLTGVTWCHMSLRLFFCSSNWLNVCYLL